MRLILISFISLCLAACGVPSALRPAGEAVDIQLIENVDVLDIETGAIARGQVVRVEDGVITHVGPQGRFNGGSGASGEIHRIDARGGLIIPGLIDMHVHVFDESDLAANLAYGVTTVRNLGGMPFHLPMARQIEEGRLLGPRLITTGTILNENGGRNTNELQSLVSGGDAARSEVRRQYAAGYRHLKLYSNLTRESFAAIREEAELLGMTLSGHPVEGSETEPLDFSATLEAGFVTIEHAESIVWFALQDDTDPERAAALARQMAQAGARVTPTLIVHDNLARIVETNGAHAERPELESFSPVVRVFEQDSYDFWARYPHDDRSRMQAFYVEMTGLMHEAGVELVVGSDAGIMVTPHGISVSQEIELLMDAGLSPLAALQAATINPAGALGLGEQIGRVEPGFAADFLLLPDNPLTDMSILRSPRGVMRDGQWFDEGALAELREASTRPSEIRTWRRVVRHVVTR